MWVVIRRFVSILALALIVTACAGSTRDAVTAGDESLSRGELMAMSSSISGVTPGSPTATAMNADQLRIDGTAYLRSLAFLEYFEAEGLLTSDVEGSASDELSTLFNTGQFGPLTFQSPEYEATLGLVTASNLLAATQVGTLNSMVDFLNPEVREVDDGQGQLVLEFVEPVRNTAGEVVLNSSGEPLTTDDYLALSPSQFVELELDLEPRFPAQAAIFEEFGGDYDIESRIGSWDDESFAIVAN